jgi:hypothetical protein
MQIRSRLGHLWIGNRQFWHVAVDGCSAANMTSRHYLLSLACSPEHDFDWSYIILIFHYDEHEYENWTKRTTESWTD